VPLLFRKLVLFWAGEYGNNEPEHFIARLYSPVPRLSIGYAVLAPLGLLGLALSRRDASRLFPLWAFGAAYMGSLVLFFVSSRYRVPVLPVLMLFAGHALACTVRQLSTRQFGRAALGALFVLAFAGWAAAQGPDERAAEANARLLLGSTEAKRNRHPEAAAHLRRAIELQPENVDAWVALAWSERSLGEVDAAIDHYRRAVELSPMHPAAFEGLLDLALAQGRDADAQKWIAEYPDQLARHQIDVVPEVAHYYRGRIHAARGEGEPARKAFVDALRADPQSFRAAIELGDLERDAQRFPEAARAYRQAIFALQARAASRRDDRAFAGLVDALEQQGRRAHACQRAMQWQARRSESPAASAARARVCG
jgi:tetratricopeptide (TPR) repeat protein